MSTQAMLLPHSTMYGYMVDNRCWLIKTTEENKKIRRRNSKVCTPSYASFIIKRYFIEGAVRFKIIS